ncbi:MAG: hypothetical protein U0231_18535 [Nitrospiraceae bacterium]
MADVQIQDGIIRIAELDIQDPKAAAVLAEYPQVRWPEITRRALKIGLGYLKGGGRTKRDQSALPGEERFNRYLVPSWR